MIIGVDGNEANVDLQVGVSIYTSELLRYFHTHASDKIRFLVYLRDLPKKSLPKETTFFKYKIIPGPIAWSQFFFPLYLNIMKDCDILFCPAHYSPRFCPVPIVLTIHDLSYYYYPEEFLKKDLYKLTHWTCYSAIKAIDVI